MIQNCWSVSKAGNKERSFDKRWRSVDKFLYLLLVIQVFVQKYVCFVDQPQSLLLVIWVFFLFRKMPLSLISNNQVLNNVLSFSHPFIYCKQGASSLPCWTKTITHSSSLLETCFIILLWKKKGTHWDQADSVCACAFFCILFVCVCVWSNNVIFVKCLRMTCLPRFSHRAGSGLIRHCPDDSYSMMF